MKYKLIVRPEAEIELQDGFGWYELQVPGLGSQFLIAVDAVVNEIRRHPLQYPSNERPNSEKRSGRKG